jgi:MscS family membrane protein
MMKTPRHGTTAALFVMMLLAGVAPAAEATKAEKLHSPRATVQTFYAAVAASRNSPTRIAEATVCLDLGAAGGPRDAELLAVDLESALRSANVTTDAIPDDDDGPDVSLPGPDGGRIGLRRQPDGRWLFDRETVAAVPTLAAAARKVLEERNKEAASLNVAPEVASPRATFHTFLISYFHGDAERTLRCLALTDVPAAARQEVGEQLARKLCQVILKTRSIVLQDLPESNYSDAYTWLSRPEGVVELVRLPAGDRKGEWVFSRQTVRSIDALYGAIEDQPYHEMLLKVPPNVLRPDLGRAPELWLRERTPAWLRVDLASGSGVRLELYQLLGVIAVAALAFAAFRLGAALLAALAARGLAWRGWALPRATVLRRLRPAGVLLACMALREGVLLLDADKTLLGVALTLLNPLAWAAVAWAVFGLIDLAGDVVMTRKTEDRRKAAFTEMFWPVGSLAAKIVLAVALVLHLMALFSWDVTAVLTGLGIGGVAFALGAQDSLRNLFGSFTLIADRPFVVGETVRIGEGGLGVVERVGLRSTSIRTVEDTVMIVPNSNLTTMNITNYGRRRFRRFTGRLGVAYGTPPQRLAAFCDGVRRMVEELRWARKDQCEVAIHDLTPSAIELQVTATFDVATGRQEAEAREALLLGCLRLAEALRIDLASPTQPAQPVPDGDAPALTLHGKPDGKERPRRASA